MKTIQRTILLLLLAVSLMGCKTKERVTEKQTEVATMSSLQTVTQTEQTELQGQTTAQEETTHWQWSDSIVEHFLERIVTDSCGRVLWHEQEHSKDSYKSKAQRQSKRADKQQEAVAAQRTEQTATKNDSTYNGGTIGEVAVVKKKSNRWLWYILLLGSLLMAGFIISKVTRR